MIDVMDIYLSEEVNFYITYTSRYGCDIAQFGCFWCFTMQTAVRNLYTQIVLFADKTDVSPPQPSNLT